MNKTNIFALVLLSCVMSQALAEGLSVGVSIGSSTVEADSSVTTIDFDANDLGWKVHGRYMFNDHWGLELGYADFGNPDDSLLGVTVEAELTGIDAFVVGSLPVSESFNFFGKAGIIAWDAELSVLGIGSADADGSDLALGLGGEFHATDRFSILGEVEWFDVEDADSVWMLSIGIAVGFN